MSDTISQSTWKNWLAVVTLAIGSFAIVTTELAPIGLLSNIGEDFQKPEATVGLIVTVYAWIAAVAALVSATTLSHLPRRPLLITLMLLLAVSSIASALARDFSYLMTARVIGALAHGAFWAMIGSLGAQIVPAHRIGLATSIIFGGVSAASVLGVPLANVIGQIEGWRTAFYCIAALSFGVAAAIFLTVPPLPGVKGINSASLLQILAAPRFKRIFAATLLSITAHFMAFTYIEPFLRSGNGLSTGHIAPLLFAFGIAGLAGNFLTGALIDSSLKTLLVGALIVSSAALCCLSFAGPSAGVALTAVMLVAWGGAVAAILVGFQTWILKEAGSAALPASAIYVAIFNAAIGLGALLGSLVLNVSGLPQVFLIAAIITGSSIFAMIALQEPSPISTAAE